jgi:hypothetical protein
MLQDIRVMRFEEVYGNLFYYVASPAALPVDHLFRDGDVFFRKELSVLSLAVKQLPKSAAYLLRSFEQYPQPAP